MNTIRVLQVIPTLGCGGAERMVVNLMRQLDQQRFEVGAITLGDSEGSALEQKLAKEKFQVWFLGKQPGFDPRICHRIRKVVRQFRPHLVHSHLCLHYVFLALIGFAQIRCVETMHGSEPSSRKRVVPWLTRIACRRGVIPVAVSRNVAEWVKRSYRLGDCMVIPNGIPIADYQHPSISRQVWRKEQGYEEGDVLFVCVARLEKLKDHAMLLEAFARGPSAEPRAHLLLLGEGACRLDLETRIRELKLQGKVRFLGQRSDVPEVLGSADVFVLASQNEGNPLSLMEAMAAGLPVVATAVGGVPELIEDLISGLLVVPGDCDGMAVAMLRLLHDAELRRTMAASAGRRAAQAFSASQMAQGYMALYESILNDGVSIVENRGTEIVTHYRN